MVMYRIVKKGHGKSQYYRAEPVRGKELKMCEESGEELYSDPSEAKRIALERNKY